MRYLGLDLGSKTLGVAISDINGSLASSLTTLNYKSDNYEDLLNELNKIIIDKKVNTIVLGLPKNMNNTMGPRCEQVLEFKDILEQKFNMNVILQDERLTTMLANNILIDADLSRKKRKQVVDKLAANIILQSYLDRKKDN
jgi:putative Holliday junction resolvase